MARVTKRSSPTKKITKAKSTTNRHTLRFNPLPLVYNQKRSLSTTTTSTTTPLPAPKGENSANEGDETSSTTGPPSPHFTLIRNEKVPLATSSTMTMTGTTSHPTRQRRVVVTGIGVVSPLGNDLNAVYNDILNGTSAITPIDTPELIKLNLQTKSYAPVGVIPEIDNPDIIPRHLKQVLSRHQIYAMVATHNAMIQAGLTKGGKSIITKKDKSLSLLLSSSSSSLDTSNTDGQEETTTPTTTNQETHHGTNTSSSLPLTNSEQELICKLGHLQLCDLCTDEPKCAYIRDDADRFGVCIGSSIGCVEEIGSAHVKVQEKGGKGAGAYSLPKLLVNLAAGHLTQLHEARALTHTVSTACATGAHAIGDATAFIRDNKADIIIAGGTETGVSPLSLALFNRIHALSRQDPKTSGGPFTSQRDGFVMGEGAAVLILEEEQHALARGANIICEVLGYGLSSDANHITQPHRLGRGAYMAMENALGDAGIEMGMVDYINAHATSTPIGDIAEASAIRALTQADYYARRKRNKKNSFTKEQRALQQLDKTDDRELPAVLPNQIFSRPLVSSTKGHVGHLLGASGALEAALSIMAITTNVPPPTLLRQGTISNNIPVNVLAFDDSSLSLPATTSPTPTITTTISNEDDNNSTHITTKPPRIQTHWESVYNSQYTYGKAHLPAFDDLVEDKDFYLNDKGYVVLTKKYHIEKGYCCENACLNCPFDFDKDKLANMKDLGLKQGQLTKPQSPSTLPRQIDVVMSNSFGFGGANATLVFGRYGDDGVTPTPPIGIDKL